MSAQQWLAAFLLAAIEDACRRGVFYTRPYVWIWPLTECLEGAEEDE